VIATKKNKAKVDKRKKICHKLSLAGAATEKIF
jgi:hypothetical protein